MASTDHALIVADGDVDAAWLGLLLGGRTKPLLIAADGGAAKVRAAGHKPDVVLGDFDSLAADARDQLEALGVELRVSARDKDESDMELCLLAALETGVARVSILGALGGVRPEHSIANLLLLADPRLDGIAIEILSRGSRITRIGTAAGAASLDISGSAGDYVSLLPLGAAVEGVSSDGLRFSLTGETLPLGPSRGLSNELLGTRARVTCKRGHLLVIHTDRSIEASRDEPREEPA